MNSRSPYSRLNLAAIFIGGWLFLFLTQSIILHRLQLSWRISYLDALVSASLIAFAALITLTIFRFYNPGKSNRLFRFILGFLLTIKYCFLLKWSLSYILADEPNYLIFLSKSIPVRFVFALLILWFITILNWLLNYLQEQKEKEKHQSDIENLLRETELSKLRQQLQPHFLFNSLNSISALVATKPNEARQMVQQLSDFLRGTLKKDEKQLVSLSEELNHLQLYLDIEKVRFGHRLNIQINTNEQSLFCVLPSLLLQPVVENAIKFGLYDTTEEITISLSSKIESGNLILEVKNPFDAQTQNSNKGIGFGLSSVQRRLYLLFGRNDLLETKKEETIFITTLKIPQTK